jgi:hypothetical protein
VNDQFPWPNLKQGAVIVAAVIAGGAALLGTAYGGFSMGRDVNAGELKDARAEVAKRSAEVDDLKAKLQRARARAEAASKDGAGSGGSIFVNGGCFEFNVLGGSAESSKFFRQPRNQVCVVAGESGEVLEGDLTISVVAVEFSGDPLRNCVTGTISGRGDRPPLRFMNEDVGAVLRYGRYRVRIDSVDTSSANFVARRIT